MALDSAYTEKMRAENPDKEFKSSEIYGMDKEEILSYFYDSFEVKVEKPGLLSRKFVPDQWKGVKLDRDLIDAEQGNVVADAGTKLTSRVIKKILEQRTKRIVVFAEELFGRYNAFDIIDPTNGLVIAEAGDELDEDLINKITTFNDSFSVLNIDHAEIGGYIRNTLLAD